MLVDVRRMLYLSVPVSDLSMGWLMRRMVLLLAFLLLLPVGSMTSLAQSGAPRPGGAPGGAPGGGAPSLPLVAPPQERAANVINRSSVAITTLYVSSTEEDNWGANRLTGTPLAAGRSLQVRLGQGRHCRFDLQVLYSDGKTEERRDQDICRNRQVVFDGSKAALPVERTARKITLLNRSPRTIKQVFLSPKTATNWGDDVLGGTIAAGDDAELSFRGDCVVDVRVVFDNSSAEERREADLCSKTTVVIAPGWTTTDEIPTQLADLPQISAAPEGPEISVVNITGKTVDELYVFPVGATEEGVDRLGNDVLEDAGNHRFRMDRRGACVFNVRAVLADRAGDIRLREVDLCAQSEIRLDGGALAPQPASPPADGITRFRVAGTVPAVAVFVELQGRARGVDRLADRLLRPGEVFDLAPPVAGQCRYHLTVIYRDGRNAELDVDMCATRELTLP